MNYFLSVSEAAEEDLRDAFLWYETQRAGLGERFEELVTQCMETILENPIKFQIRYSETHICFLKKFPYGIHFVINELEILVISVFHTSRSPKTVEETKIRKVLNQIKQIFHPYISRSGKSFCQFCANGAAELCSAST